MSLCQTPLYQIFKCVIYLNIINIFLPSHLKMSIIVIVSNHCNPGVAAAGAESRGAGVGAQAGAGGQHRRVGALGVAACLHRVQPRLLDSLQLGTAG